MEKRQKIYEGKAKIVYSTDDPGKVIQYFKDDATAFNALKRGTILGKGVVNNKMSAVLFARLAKAGVPTHYLGMLSEREMICRRLSSSKSRPFRATSWQARRPSGRGWREARPSNPPSAGPS